MAKRKTRPGGQPDGSSYMGAWGGWALAPNTASMGRDNRSHIYWSREGGGTFKRSGDFFNFFGGRFRTRNSLRGGAIRLARGGFVGRHGRGWRTQGSAHGNVMPVRNIFSRWPVRNRGDRHRWRADGGDLGIGIRLPPTDQIVPTADPPNATALHQ